MELRPIGWTGLSVSTVGLGGLELGPEVGEEPDIDRAVGVIEAALEAGVKWLDTSDDGLVRSIGLSNYELDDVERCHGQRPVDVVEDGLSLIVKVNSTPDKEALCRSHEL